IYLGKGEHAVREYIFQLPPAFPKVLTMPRDFFWNAPSGAGSYSVKCRMLPGGKPAVKVTVEYISRQSILTPAEYRQLVDACRKLASPDMNSIILTR
ncbi:MAG: hypothetical protein J6S21_01575, partial [Victivallales bacterium]|nr:hypothetical protein [Victivallales bacterium]